MADTNRSFCLRLAQEIFPTLAAYPDSPLIKDLTERFLQTCHPSVPCVDTLGHLATQLELRPDIQSYLAGITEYTPSKWLLERELESAGMWSAKMPEDAYGTARRRDAVGLCLSGGGIRSATFNLGILQSLARGRHLSKLDYLSSVSGGGYIHQFLANWIFKTGSVGDVERLMDPIPNAPGTAPLGTRATLPPEPVRWLRSYSNYLAPRKGFFSLDSWTIVAVWARNTVLNLLVLLSTLFFILLLPHIGTILHTPGEPSRAVSTILYSTLAIVYITIAVFVYRWLGELGMTGTVTALAGPPAVLVKSTAAVLFLASSLIAPAVYRSILPEGSIESPTSKEVFKKVNEPQELHYRSTYTKEHGPKEHVEVTVDQSDPAPASRHVDFQHKPRLLWNEMLSPQKPPMAIWMFLLLCSVFLVAVVAASELNTAWSLLFVPFGAIVAYALLEGVRLLFYVSAFYVDPRNVSPLGVVMLPTLLFGIPFITTEAGLGLIGRASSSHQREWLARIRAFSFLLGGSWLTLSAFSLFGPVIFDNIASYTKTSYGVWAGWIATSVAGVLSAKSESTSKGKASHSDTPSIQSTVMESVAKIAPWVFVSGLLILLAKGVGLSIEMLMAHFSAWVALGMLAGVSFAVAGLFGWRVDINDFSMHSFYRDRLARAYAGATTPNRMPNRFTGFTTADAALRVDELLPKGHVLRDDAGNVTQTGMYDGPFPIVCTAINLTTGEDLAYQERKAASFTFTPLMSGFNVGWTNARDAKNQFNGFVTTRDYVYAQHHRLMMATAVAISGAAASPNMGYHTNPAVAFLLTVFNVRLGWWLRNPRRRKIGLRSAHPTPVPPPAAEAGGPFSVPHTPPKKMPEKVGYLPSSPRWGLLKLVNELMGLSDDTTSYIYLTDGGHFDNMGLYELLRRRCRRIIVCDGEADCRLSFEGIGMAIRKARVDFGVEVVLDKIQPVPEKTQKVNAADVVSLRGVGTAEGEEPTIPEQGKEEPEPPPAKVPMPYVLSARVSQTDPMQLTGTLSRHQPPAPVVEGLSSFEDFPANSVHAVHGTIRYPEDGSEEQFGHILYIKASLTGDEPADVLNYRRQHEKFPHDTTLNQFFTESQFESYRRLGEHIVAEDPTVISWLKAHLGS